MKPVISQSRRSSLLSMASMSLSMASMQCWILLAIHPRMTIHIRMAFIPVK